MISTSAMRDRLGSSKQDEKILAVVYPESLPLEFWEVEFWEFGSRFVFGVSSFKCNHISLKFQHNLQMNSEQKLSPRERGGGGKKINK